MTETVAILKSHEVSDAETFGSDNATHRALILRGKNSDGNHSLAKIAIDENNKVISSIPSEGCIGSKECSDCKFSPNGGCEGCGDVVCNHQIKKVN